MTDKKSNERRRKLLKSIAAGSGVIVAGKSLPESWSRPIVDSVMLPAHAQTSLTSTHALFLPATETGINPPGAINVSVQGNTASIAMWFEFNPGSDLTIFQASVPIGPEILIDMTLVSQTCGFEDSCQVFCYSAGNTVNGQFDLNGEGMTGFSAPQAAYIPPPPADCAGGGGKGKSNRYRS